jgi:hypothetical protein
MSAKYVNLYLHRGSIRLIDYKKKQKKQNTYEMKKTKNSTFIITTKYIVILATTTKIPQTCKHNMKFYKIIKLTAVHYKKSLKK